MALAAADAHGVEYRKAYVNKPPSGIEPSVAHGTVRCIIGHLNYLDVAAADVAETTAINNIIYLGGSLVPPGATIFDFFIASNGDAGAGEVFLRVGEVYMNDVAVTISTATGVLVRALPGDWDATGNVAPLPYTMPSGDAYTDAIGTMNFECNLGITTSYDIWAAIYYMQD